MTDLPTPAWPPRTPTEFPSGPVVPFRCAVEADLAQIWLDLLIADSGALIDAITSQRDSDMPLGDAVDALAGGGVLPADHVAALNSAPEGLKIEVLNAAVAAAESGMALGLTVYEPDDNTDIGARTTTWYQLDGETVGWREIAVQVPKQG